MKATSCPKNKTAIKVWCLIGKAILIREFNRLDLLVLPPVQERKELQKKDIEKEVRRIFCIVNMFVFWRWRKCFYRAYIAGFILRQAKVPLIFNIGIPDPFTTKRIRGHCWLTLDGELVHEPASTQLKYPELIGQVPNQINYWVGRKAVHQNCSVRKEKSD